MYYVPFKQGTGTRAMWSSVFLKKKTVKSIGAIRSRKDLADKILTGQLKPDKGSAEIMKHDTVSLSGQDV